ncbi:MAG: metallophosphoesterase [Planctomycetes bacterium]|nr:metallophosphoesterase [Planctomycetota bacterium]
MKSWKYIIAFLVLTVVHPVWAQTSVPPSETPPNFKVAFIADQGLGKNAEAVLKLIKSEGAQTILHQGDFDYKNNPSAWEAQIDRILGADFPYFASIGNHDIKDWYGKEGYQEYLKNRLNRQEIKWDGDLGVKSSIRYKGIFIILVAPGELGYHHDVYIRDQLARDKSIWRICSWHKNMQLMQVGGKKDDTGWGVYEEARKGGAIIATAHDHSYGRSYPLSSFVNQTISSHSNRMVITEGRTFAFFSGLGGGGIHEQKLDEPWWAKVYTKTQNATYGALFGIFNVNGIPNKAMFYFKNINGEVIDHFNVTSTIHNNLVHKGNQQRKAHEIHS